MDQPLARLFAAPRNRRTVQACAGFAAVLATLIALWDGGGTMAVAVGLVGLLTLSAIKLSLIALVSLQTQNSVIVQTDPSVPTSPDRPPSANVERSGEVPVRHTRSRVPYCPICGGTEFDDYNGRPVARCTTCGSLERHRVCFDVYSREGVFSNDGTVRRAIQFAPEQITFDLLASVPGLDYVTADLNPQRYPYADPMQIRLPEGLEIFPEGHFDFVIHNHVWEHIPGAWQDHVEPLKRVLSIGGKMIFTFPYSIRNAPEETVEFGELLPSDEDRLRVFGLADHVRKFGRDFLELMSGIEGTEFRLDGLSDDEKRAIAGFAGDDPEAVFILERTA